MDIKWQVKLLSTAFKNSQFPKESLPEIAIAGRSNVGKSSLLNKLVNARIAHVGATPGKTRSINFYLIDTKSPFILVDLPGYGFASRSKNERKQWSSLIENYILNRKTIGLLISLVDFRHGLLQNDRILQEWISSVEIPMLTVFTKVDKISKGKRKYYLHKYVRDGLRSIDVPFMVSAITGDGIEPLKAFLEHYITDSDSM